MTVALEMNGHLLQDPPPLRRVEPNEDGEDSKEGQHELEGPGWEDKLVRVQRSNADDYDNNAYY